MLKDSYGSVTSADGTSIGYRMIGEGPGLILVQGAMGTATNYDELARSLAASFTVYLPDRRGRGMSPLAYDPAHTIRRDIEDLASLLEYSGAPFIFGLSSGAIIALAAAALRSIEKVAIYEPPFVPGGISHLAIKRFNYLVEQRRLAAALVQASKIVKLGSKILAYVPQWILRFGTHGSWMRATPRVRTLRASQRIDPGHAVRFQRCRQYGWQSGVVRGLAKRSPVARRRSQSTIPELGAGNSR
jgi:pimeloyl-ACP methyl ester carboxylesterase